jgi:hypothetical protein
MAKEPSIDFIKSIAKFKKNFVTKKSGKANYKTKLKMVDDFLITKTEKESGNYASLLKQNDNEDLKNQILHRIERYNIFLDSLPDKIVIPKSLYDNFKDPSDLYKYFISSQRKNAIVHKLVSTTEIELAIASKIVDNFYVTNNVGFNENEVVIEKIRR